MNLVEIDLSRTCAKPGAGDSGKNWHPDIDTTRYYLAEVQWDDDGESQFWAGQFSEVWFGYNFNCGFGASGFQLDKPEPPNSVGWVSCWRRLWLIEPDESE